MTDPELGHIVDWSAPLVLDDQEDLLTPPAPRARVILPKRDLGLSLVMADAEPVMVPLRPLRERTVLLFGKSWHLSLALRIRPFLLRIRPLSYPLRPEDKTTPLLSSIPSILRGDHSYSYSFENKAVLLFPVLKIGPPPYPSGLRKRLLRFFLSSEDKFISRLPLSIMRIRSFLHL